jgi:PAS domain S-box-containing protein
MLTHEDVRGPARILIVEDEGIVARDIQNRLTSQGYVVAGSAETGADAIRLSDELRPDLVLMDVRLRGGMDGVEAAQHIRARWQIPVVYLTAYADDATLRRARVTEPFGYILKPFEERELPTVIEMALYKHEAERRLRASERRYATTLSSIADAVIASDAAGRVTFLNRAAETLTGWPQAEAMGRSLAEVCQVINEQDRSRIEAPDAGGPERSALLLGRDGREHLIDSRAAPIQDDDGRCTGVVLIFRDITEKRRLEAQLRQAQRMEGIGRLAGGIAHDFNNLLTIINGYCNLILEGMDADHAWHGFLTEVHKAGERAASLTQQLLAFSRKQMLQPKVVDLNVIVANLEKMLGRLIGEHILLSTRLQPNPTRVWADPGQIEQVILNLVVNARDAMPQGGELILQTANTFVASEAEAPSPDMPPGPYHLLTVRDTGCGMDAAMRARLFEPFFTTKELGKGTGMGLATVYGIVKQSDGFIQVDSEVGRGSTFTIWLPAVSEAPPEEVRLPHASRLPRGSETVLLAEDDEAVRLLVRQVLDLCGYTVLEARHGVEALQMSQQYVGDIHLLATDVRMPHMGGHELAEHLRYQRPGLRVLFLSGYSDNPHLRQDVRDGTADHLQKPFAPAVLAARVRELLDR